MTRTPDPIGSLHEAPSHGLRDLLVAAKRTGQPISIVTIVDTAGIRCTVTNVGSADDPLITASSTVSGKTATYWIPLSQIVRVDQFNREATVPTTMTIHNSN